MAAASFTIVFGSALALRTPNLKRRLAYSTVANLSYILLAFASMDDMGLTAGLLHMVFHAVTKITLFFCAGAMLHHNDLEYIYDMNGLGRKMPVTCAAFTLAGLALMGIPPLGGFLTKWLIATAAAANGHWASLLCVVALILSATLTSLYIMTVVVRLFFPLKSAKPLPEGVREADRLLLGPLVFLAVLLVALSLLSYPLTEWIGGLV